MLYWKNMDILTDDTVDDNDQRLTDRYVEQHEQKNNFTILNCSLPKFISFSSILFIISIIILIYIIWVYKQPLFVVTK
jgi:hypothetical protein